MSYDDYWSSFTVGYAYDGHDLHLSLKIQNFLDYQCIPGKNLEIHQIECLKCCRTKWILSVYPYGRSEEEKDNVAIFLKLKTQPHAKVGNVMFEIKLLGRSDHEFKISDLGESERITLTDGYGFLKLMTRREIKKKKDLYLPNGHLTIRCRGTAAVSQNAIATSKVMNISLVSNRHSELMKKMYQESIGCDVVVKSGSSEFKCHKNVLAASSAYFKAMFQHDMKENRENEVDLSKDLNEEELGALIDYIYLENPGLEKLSRASLQNLYKKGESSMGV